MAVYPADLLQPEPRHLLGLCLPQLEHLQDERQLGSKLFGKFINARGHYTSVLLYQTCHGMPHGENPSTQALDNVQNQTLQNAVAGAVYPNGVNSTYPLGICDVCHRQKSTTWSVPPHEL